ncbi:MAG: hypothetical protein AAB436_02370 [Patescibacteria group bacterium]
MDQDNIQPQPVKEPGKQQGQGNSFSADYATAEVVDAARTAESLKMNDAVRETAEPQARDVAESTRDSATKAEEAIKPEEAVKETAAAVDPVTIGDSAATDAAAQAADNAQIQIVVGSDNVADAATDAVVDSTIAYDDSGQIDTASLDAAYDVSMGDSDSVASPDDLADLIDD